METVADYIRASRILLQDTEAGAYRYSDDELVMALDISLREARRLRPDMFKNGAIPKYSGLPITTETVIPSEYFSAFVYYVTGHAQLRDAEENQDARSTVFLNKFVAQLTSFPS